tara:strand:+ start:829 stop:1203 length:375 start_codon:yes stop_codon:yes gene_type:complete
MFVIALILIGVDIWSTYCSYLWSYEMSPGTAFNFIVLSSIPDFILWIALATVGFLKWKKVIYLLLIVMVYTLYWGVNLVYTGGSHYSLGIPLVLSTRITGFVLLLISFNIAALVIVYRNENRVD